MLSRTSRVIYVQASGVASFALPSVTTRTAFTPSQSAFSCQLRQQLRRFASTTTAVPPPPPPHAAAVASAAASAAAPELAASAPKQSFFKSDSWTKTVGTIGALANWSIPLAVSAALRPHTQPDAMCCVRH